MILCNVNFNDHSLQPVDRVDVVYKLQWFQLDSAEDFIRHSAVKIDWPYKGTKGLFVVDVNDGFIVFIRGSFDNWLTSIPLPYNPESHSKEVILLLPGSFVMFFITVLLISSKH
jgi:hypothetical protein